MITEEITQEALEGFPKKTLLKMANEMGLTGLSRKDKEAIIEAIIEASEEDTEEEIEEVKTNSSPEEALKDVTLQELMDARPDLVKEIKTIAKIEFSKMQAPKEETTNHDERLFEVKLGPIGPAQVSAVDAHHAVQKFMRQSGCTGYAKVKPEVKEITD